MILSAAFSAAAAGKYSPGLKDITYFQTPELEITCDETVAFQADGELSGRTPVKFRKAPFPLQVIA